MWEFFEKHSIATWMLIGFLTAFVCDLVYQTAQWIFKESEFLRNRAMTRILSELAKWVLCLLFLAFVVYVLASR